LICEVRHKNLPQDKKLVVRAPVVGHIRKGMGSPKGLSLAASFLLSTSNLTNILMTNILIMLYHLTDISVC